MGLDEAVCELVESAWVTNAARRRVVAELDRLHAMERRLTEVAHSRGGGHVQRSFRTWTRQILGAPTAPDREPPA